MDKNIAIEFQNVGKQYRLGLVGTGTLQHDLNRWFQTSILGREDPYLKIGEVNDRSTKGNSDYVWALKDISFKVEQGDVVGIIGKNGAGKSTLLKLLSHITAPSTGDIWYRGRIASLLEVGTGFHPEMTARQNIYMNGNIMGMTRHEIDRKLDEIVDFAGIARYIDTPVKRFSSGMTVRLGFAVAAFLEPEILVVDEVLAVGDAEFQKKAIGKMKEVSSEGGRTVLFVSHNMNSVRNLCSRGIVLENGCICYDGEVKDAVKFYLRGNKQVSDLQTIKDGITEKVPYIKIYNIFFNGSQNRKSTIKYNQEYLEVTVDGETKIPIKSDLSLTFRTIEETPLACFSNGFFSGEVDRIPAGKFRITKRIKLPKYICSGQCLVDIAMHDPNVVIHFNAPQSVMVEIEGSMGMYGKASIITEDGLVGFEPYE